MTKINLTWSIPISVVCCQVQYHVVLELCVEYFTVITNLQHDKKQAFVEVI